MLKTVCCVAEVAIRIEVATLTTLFVNRVSALLLTALEMVGFIVLGIVVKAMEGRLSDEDIGIMYHLLIE